MKPGCCILAMLIALPLCAGKKPSGEIPDPAALAKVHSYCIDTSNLKSDEAYDVEGFIKTENKPKKLLSKLPWKFLPDCREGNPDAVVRVQFSLVTKIDVGLGQASRNGDAGQDPESDLYSVRALFEVTPAHALWLLYKVEAAPLDNPENDPSQMQEPPPVLRRGALYGAFRTLIEDLRKTSGGK